MLVTFVYLSEIVLGKSLGTFTSLTFNDVTMVNFGLVPDYWRGLPYCKTKSACDYDSTTHSCHTLTGMDTAITGDISPDCLARSADACEHFMMPLHTCATNCYCNLMGDGVCDEACNNAACDLDGGDCCSHTFTTDLTLDFDIWEYRDEATAARSNG